MVGGRPARWFPCGYSPVKPASARSAAVRRREACTLTTHRCSAVRGAPRIPIRGPRPLAPGKHNTTINGRFFPSVLLGNPHLITTRGGWQSIRGLNRWGTGRTIGIATKGALASPSPRALSRQGDWWSPLVLRDISLGIDTFEDPVRDLGVPRALLKNRLDRLADGDVLERVEYSARPQRFVRPEGVSVQPGPGGRAAPGTLVIAERLAGMA